MQRILPGSARLIVVIILFLSWGCTKIDTTTLGNDLIPAVDNVHTFADTLTINGTQGIFNDSTRINASEYHPLGIITNDPVFGKTSADLYLQLKPGFFPFYFGNAGDTIDPALNAATGFDCVVLCLSFKTFYGDTFGVQHLRVLQLDNNVTNFKNGTISADSSFPITFLPNAVAGETLLGEKDIDPRSVRNYTYFKGSSKDSVTNQIRIPLNNSFLQTLITNRDTSAAANGMFRSDSLFKDKIKGFRITAQGTGIGNGLFYVALDDAATRLEVHYRKIKKNVIDTAFTAFSFSSGLLTTASVQATHLERDRTGAEVETPHTEELYIQTTPGTYANLSIPQLSAFQNSIIHRAELVVEQIPSVDPIDKIMSPPSYLYLDLANDTATAASSKFKPVYYDLNPAGFYNPDNFASVYNLLTATGIDYTSFGGYLRVRDAGGGIPQYYYTFNISRHIQHIVTNGVNNYNLRLYAPNKLNYYGFSFGFRNLLADGRIKIGNGNNTNAQYRMFLRIVYSKI